MPEWNSDQKKAIDTRDRGVIVSAAAGSGKTTVLVERTIRMLSDTENRLPADRLLAVTFTTEAAGQLRRKLSAALEKALRAEPDADKRRWLKEQHERLALARISTINAFCYDLVKSNLHRFEYRDGVKIIDEEDAEVLLNESFAEALDVFAKEHREQFDLLYDALGNGDAMVLLRYGRLLYSFLMSLPFPKKWIASTRQNMRERESVEKWIDAAFHDEMILVERAAVLCEKVIAEAAALDKLLSFPKKRFEVLLDDRELIQDIKKRLYSGDWAVVYSLTELSFAGYTGGSFPNDATEEYNARKAALLQLRNKYKGMIDKIKKTIKTLGRDIDAPLALSENIFDALVSFVALARDIMKNEKERRNILEFSDVERMTIELLLEENEDGTVVRSDLAREIAGSREFMVVLIDEFQDVNNLQDLIFKALSDTDDLDVLGKNVFVVGDIKQSIYRFRQSNPKLFTDAKKAAADERWSGQLELVELKKNYRSRKNIIDFVNLVFSQLMNEEIGEVQYIGGERLENGADYPGEDPAVEVLFVDREADSEDEDTEERDENYAIAARIREMLDTGFMVSTDDRKELRPCRPGDFCILYRGKKSVLTLEKAFETYGLKVAAERGLGYLRSREICIMTDLLRVIDNPMKDIPMAAVMLSPLLGFSDDDLTRIRLYCMQEGKLRLHLYQAVLDICSGKSRSGREELLPKDETIKAKCAECRELISRFSFYSSGMTITRLIRKIYDETEILAAASSFEDSIQKRANLRMLLKYADSYSENGDGSVYGFLRYLENIADNGKDFHQAMTIVENDDCINVKTIHASKGLEYPIVIMSGLYRKFNDQDLRRGMMLDEVLGAGFVIYDHEKMIKTNTLAYQGIRSIELNKMLSEELRLLYVALTRAKEHIILPISMVYGRSGKCETVSKLREIAEDIRDSGTLSPSLLRSTTRYAHWILAALLRCEGSEELLNRLGIEDSPGTYPEKAKIVYSEYHSDSSLNTAETEFYRGVPDEAETRRLAERMSCRDSFGSVSAASKMTVTEITGDIKLKELGKENPMFFPNLPRLSDELTRLTAAKRGTYTHLFMELADYGSCEKSVKAELERLVENRSFTPEQAAGIYLSAVEKFFAGDFYKRLKASKEIMREKKFLVNASDIRLSDKFSSYLADGSMLQGVADCIFLENDGYILVDYKTDNFKDISEIYGYSTQLELYKAALDLILDKPVTACYIYSFKLNEGVEIAL